jgi:hypothetical protein
LKILTANNPKSPITYALSCRDINDNWLSTWDGVYYINPTGTGSFQAYCDMTTDGGGWTMIFNEKNIWSFWDGTNKYTNFAWEINCTWENRNCVNRSYSTVPVTNGVMLDGAWFDIGINKYSSKVVFNWVNNIKYRTLYYLFNNSGAQSTPTETHWLINEPKIITWFQNSVSAWFGWYTWATSNLLWDYWNIIYQFQNIVLNEDQASWLDWLISGAWDNGCKWPNNPCFPDHWYSNYRLWFR